MIDVDLEAPDYVVAARVAALAAIGSSDALPRELDRCHVLAMLGQGGDVIERLQELVTTAESNAERGDIHHLILDAMVRTSRRDGAAASLLALWSLAADVPATQSDPRRRLLMKLQRLLSPKLKPELEILMASPPSPLRRLAERLHPLCVIDLSP